MDNTGKVILSKGIKLDKQYKNIVDYTETQMVNLCLANKVYETTDCSFIKINESIEVDCPYGVAITANYIAYQNPNYSSKWFFAFIDKVEYVSDGTTSIHFTIDELSTWRDYWQIQPTFVVREHVNDDTIGLHTVPEELETGEYVVNNKIDVLDSTDSTFHGGSNPSLFIIMGVTEAPSGDNVSAGLPSSRMYDGLFQGLYFLAFDSVADVENVIKMYDMASSSSAIYCIFTAPRSLVGANMWTIPHTWTYTKNNTTITATIYHIDTSYGGLTNTYITYTPCSPNYRTVGYGTADEHRIYNIDGYEFKNNKMLTFPFSYLYVTNNAGGDCVYRYEDFKLSKITLSNADIINARLNVYGCLSPSPQTRIVPCDYKHLLSSGVVVPNYTYGLSGQRFPASSWNSDYYTNWLTQNGVNSNTRIITSAVSSAVGIGTGGIGLIAGVMNYGKTMADLLTQKYEASITPDQAKGDVNCGDINYSTGKTGFTIQAMSIRREMAVIIDNYFNLRGYRVNELKVPNETGRTYWNYVQIASESSIGTTKNTISVPTSSMDVINNAYRAGVTIWHDHANIGNYSLNNTIVTPTP